SKKPSNGLSTLDGFFDVPRAAVQAGYGQTTSVPPADCESLSDLPHPPDCVVPFDSHEDANDASGNAAQYSEPLPPHGSGTLLLISARYVDLGYLTGVPD